MAPLFVHPLKILIITLQKLLGRFHQTLVGCSPMVCCPLGQKKTGHQVKSYLKNDIFYYRYRSVFIVMKLWLRLCLGNVLHLYVVTWNKTTTANINKYFDGGRQDSS